MIAFFSINWIVQSFHKPSEVIGLADKAFFKTPEDTWKAYGTLFREHSTSICTPEFLAGLAQAETSGNPIARTYWVWRWSWNPFKIYQPASSSTGLYQITDGNFEVTRELCIHNGKVAHTGRWMDPSSCWFNGLYNRLIPSHAIEMTSAYLHQETESAASAVRKPPLTLPEKRNLAAMIHLCGPNFARAKARSRFRVRSNETCAGTRIEPYLRRVDHLSRLFQNLSGNHLEK